MWGVIVAAILGIAGTAISAGVNNKNQREAKEEAKGLATIAREDDQKQKLKDYKLNLEGLELNKETVALKNKELNSTISMNNKLMRQKQLSTLGQSLDAMSARDQNMTNFVLSLYGNKKGA